MTSSAPSSRKSTPETPDDSIIERLCRRDSSAFAELYDGYRNRVYRTVHQIVRNRFIAEELTQEVFLKAWLRANDFELGKSRTIAAWILSIARNRSIDYLRSCEGRMSNASRRLLPVDSLADGPDHDERIARAGMSQ